MINKEQALIIVHEYLNQEKNKKIFRIPSYKGAKKILYWLYVLFKKIKYGKLYLDDYDHIGRCIAPYTIKEILEPFEVYRIVEFDKAFIFFLGTKLNKDSFGYFRYFEDDIKGHILLDKDNGDLYYIHLRLILKVSYNTFIEYKNTGIKKYGQLDKIE